MNRALRENHKHPFSSAIRRYGPENFTVFSFGEFADRDAALQEEIRLIKGFAANTPLAGYNLSPGGEYDATYGRKIFWDRLRSDPAAMKIYIEKLSAAQRKRGAAGLIDSTHLVAYNASLPAKVRWKRSYRALRIARRSVRKNFTVPKPHAPGFMKAVYEGLPASVKKRVSITSRKNAKKQWAQRTPQEIKDVSEKIAETLRVRYAKGSALRSNLAEAAARGRATMDREKQGAASSAGLKRFWVDIKQDPVRYRAYLDSRKSEKTLEALRKGREGRIKKHD